MTTRNDIAQKDDRPKYGRWAPGDYHSQCIKCGQHFIGDKRAMVCADCAYGQTK